MSPPIFHHKYVANIHYFLSLRITTFSLRRLEECGPPSVLPARAADSAWADHQGAFDFSSYQQSAALPGFAYKKLRAGTGDRPAQFQQVFVHYVSYLPDGTRVDSSYGTGDGQPFAFRISAKGLGRGSRTANDEKAITGFENVAVALQPGARVVVKIPAEAAYGAAGSLRSRRRPRLRCVTPLAPPAAPDHRHAWPRAARRA